MALARLNVPGLVLYGGTIAPGKYRGKDVTIQDVFEAVGANAAGKMTDAELLELEDVACPGAGACGGQYTANTMSTVMELIGLSPMGFNGVPAMDPRRTKSRSVRRGDHGPAAERAITPQRHSDPRTRSKTPSPASPAPADRPTPSFTCSRSRAKRASRSHIDDFQKVSERTPLLAT